MTLGCRQTPCSDKAWISEPTLNISEDRRAVRLRGDKPGPKTIKKLEHGLVLNSQSVLRNDV